MLARLYTENRVVVPLEKIPKNLQNATISLEDKRFYQHHGIDPEGIARSIWGNVRSHDLFSGGGGSTLEQQLVRNLGVNGLTKQKTLSRKVHEWIAAVQLERTKSKQEILEMYLNQVNYGSGCFGVEAAAETYFGKHVQDLDLAQCALLAGLPNRTFYNPYYHKSEAKKQRAIVLSKMLEQGYITQDMFNKADAEPIKLASAKPPSIGSQIYSAPYFVNYVIDQLKREYGEDEIDQGNLRVYTSLNFKLQQIAEQVVHDHINPDNQNGPTQAALVAIDPKTGEIKAMVGGVDYKTNNFNLATQAKRQPGSLMKVVVYAAAIDSGLVNRDTRVYDAPETFKLGTETYTPQDDNRPSYNRVSLITAFANSINIPAVKVLNMMGPPTAVRYGHVMGINSRLDPVLSLALGSSPVTPLEMTDVYATVANGGNHPEPMAIVRLTDNDDNTIEDVQPAIDQGVLAPNTVAFLNDMTRATVTDGTASQGAGDIPDAHGKTGTTQDHKDVWFIGYNSDIVVGVWAGHPLHNKHTGKDSYGQPMSREYWGNTVSVPIWHDFMQKAIPVIAAEKARIAAAAAAKTAAAASTQQAANSASSSTSAKTETTKPAPSASNTSAPGTVDVNIDKDTGLLAPAGAPNSHVETFAAGSAPTQMSPQYIKNTPTSTTPASPDTDTSDANGVVAPPPSPSDAGTSAPPAVPAATPQAVTPAPLAPVVTPPPAPTPKPVIAPVHQIAPPAPRVVEAPAPTPAPRPAPPRQPATVSVLINPEDGLLATKWDPVTAYRTYTRGSEPKKYSKMYGPPPGEH
jgi:penicillin-binding protein 1A